MKKLGIALVAIVVACLLIAGCTTEEKEEKVINSPYTVSHELKKGFLSEELIVFVEGPADDLLLNFTDGKYSQEGFLSREQMAASPVSKANFFISKPGDYRLTIRESDPSKTKGSLVYTGSIVIEPGKIEIQKVVPSDWPFSTAMAVIHHYEGEFPVTIDYLMVYTDEGEEKFGSPVKLGPGETKKVLVSYDGRRGKDIRIYAYNSDDEVIATFEGEIT